MTPQTQDDPHPHLLREADDEHDDWAWWRADIDDWPAEADERLKLMAALLGS